MPSSSTRTSHGTRANQPRTPKKYAVLIWMMYEGQRNPRSGDNFELLGHGQDSEALLSLLENLGYTVYTLKNGGKKRIEAFLDKLHQSVDEGDRVFVWIAGHGIVLRGEPTDRLKNRAFLPKDWIYDKDTGYRNAILFENIKKHFVDKLPWNVSLFMIFETCFSGNPLGLGLAFPDDDYGSRYRIGGATKSRVITLTSSMASQKSHHHPKGSLMTQSFVSAIENPHILASPKKLHDIIQRKMDEGCLAIQRASPEVQVQQDLQWSSNYFNWGEVACL